VGGGAIRRIVMCVFQFKGHLPVGFQSFVNLTEVHAENNQLVALVDRDPSGPGYRSLRRLDLALNRLNGSIDLSVFRNLRVADLDGNLITGFAGNGSVPQSLQILSLRDNLFTALPEGFRSMPNLWGLYLANNHISQWPNWGGTPPGFCNIWHIGDEHFSDLLHGEPPPDWGSLANLDISNNPINVDVTEFFMPLKWQTSLVNLDASNCSLHGPLRCDAFFAFDRNDLERISMNSSRSFSSSGLFVLDPKWSFPNLAYVSLSDNKITAIDTNNSWWLEQLYHADFHNNSLVRVTNGGVNGVPIEGRSLFTADYASFTGNPGLRSKTSEQFVSLVPIEKCQDLRNSSEIELRFLEKREKLFHQGDEGDAFYRLGIHRLGESRPLVPDPQGYVVQRVDDGDEHFECTELCSELNQIKVDYTFDSDALCRCLPGYEGTGINCTKCPAGTYSNRQAGTQICKRCPDDAGSEEGSAACYCRLGYERRGDEPCEPCTAGSVGVRKGGSGGGGSRGTWICQNCLFGVDCSVPVNYNASVLPGFFQLTVHLSDASSVNVTREVATYSAGLTLLPVVMPCPLLSACRGTNKTNGLNICSEGHEGFVCNRCRAGFSRQTPQQPCAPCAPLWQIAVVNVLLAVATLMAFFILTALAKRGAASPRAEVPSQLTKIGLSHITAVCGLAFVVFDESIWGDQIASLVGPFFAWDGGVPQSYQVWECVLRHDKCVLYRHAMWLALPLLWLTIAPLVASGIDRARRSFKPRRRIGNDDSISLATDSYLRSLSAPPSVTDGKREEAAAKGPYQRSVTFQEDSRAEPVTPPSCQHSFVQRNSSRWRQLFDDRGTMMVVVLTLIHPTVTKSMLALLQCRPYPFVDTVIPIAEGESVSLLSTDPADVMRRRMDLDSDVICGSAEHVPFLWIAVAGLSLWTLAPVVCGVAFLWRHRDGLQDPHTRRRVGFLYAGYRKPYVFWDAVLAMRRVLVLLIAQQATAQPRQQLLGWTVVAAVCVALQLTVWPFDRGSMDILNRTELRGLLVWLMSLFVMQFVVMLPEGTSLALTIALVLAVIAANLVHYVMLTGQICRYGLLQVGYRFTALTDRKKAIARVMSGCVTGPLVSWLIHQEEDRRRVSPKVFYDWSSAALSAADGPRAASGGCRPSSGPVYLVVAAMQLMSAAVQDAIETLKLTHVPGDFQEFLWSHAVLVQTLPQKRVETRSRRGGQVVVHLPRPDDRTARVGLRQMGTSDLSNALRRQCPDRSSTLLEAGKTYDDEPSGPLGAPHIDTRPADSGQAAVVSAGITLYDLQANLCYVVDELVTREQLHQAALRRRADGGDLDKADTEGHTGGWRGLYEAFRKAKRTLIEAGSPPEAIPEILASLAPTVVDTPCGDNAECTSVSGAASLVGSTQSRPSDSPAALTPPCHSLTRVDWHRLSSDDKDSLAVLVSSEAVYDALTTIRAGTDEDDS